MEQKMEQSKEMTAQESLSLISEMLNTSRRSILRKSAMHFILWGLLLVVSSLVIYELWHVTGSPKWNLLWFVMPIIGFPLVKLLDRDKIATPQNIISKQLHYVWLAYCIFALVISAIAVFISPKFTTLLIVVVLGFAECVSGILLKNWPVIVGGFLLSVGGAVVAMLLQTEAQLLIFTLGGVILVVTGLIVKSQYK